MTALWSSIPLLKEELVDRLVDLSIQGRKDEKFQYSYNTEKDYGDFRTHTGKPRLFQFGETEHRQTKYFGADNIGSTRVFSIEILYPRFGSWPDVMESDYSIFRKDLITNRSTVTGVQLRETRDELPPTIERLDDGWQLVTFYVWALFDES